MPEAAPVIAKKWPVIDAMAVVEMRVEGMNLDAWIDGSWHFSYVLTRCLTILLWSRSDNHNILNSTGCRFTAGQLQRSGAGSLLHMGCSSARHNVLGSWAETEPQVRVRRHGWRRRKPQRNHPRIWPPIRDAHPLFDPTCMKREMRTLCPCRRCTE
jgi:hypothetical protein